MDVAFELGDLGKEEAGIDLFGRPCDDTEDFEGTSWLGMTILVYCNWASSYSKYLKNFKEGACWQQDNLADLLLNQYDSVEMDSCLK